MERIHTVNRVHYSSYMGYTLSFFRDKIKIHQLFLSLFSLFIACWLIYSDNTVPSLQSVSLIILSITILFGIDYYDWKTSYIIEEKYLTKDVKIPVLSYFYNANIDYTKIDLVFYCEYSERFFFRDVSKFPKMTPLIGYHTSNIPTIIRVILSKNNIIKPFTRKNFYIQKFDKIDTSSEIWY